MSKWKYHAATFFYVLSIAFILINFLAVVVIHGKLIFLGKGIGNFAVIWMLGYMFISGLLYSCARIFGSRVVLDKVFFVLMILSGALIVCVPVNFYVS